MTVSHSPAPWRVEADCASVGPAGGFEPFGGCGCCGSPWMTAGDRAQALADAHLIVAAPDMLAALKAVITDETWGVDHPTYLLCRAAIRKAEGRSE